jgi:methylated-DNA-protein-cysteine methyltransferase related protein
MKNKVVIQQKDVSSPKHQSFFEDVWDVVRQIPPGRVTTYGAIAKYLGTKMSARMVGWALNSAHYVQPPIPAQRVVNRMGMLSGKAHFNPPSSMQEALEKEGLTIKDDVIQNFDKYFWDPSTELTL